MATCLARWFSLQVVARLGDCATAGATSLAETRKLVLLVVVLYKRTDLLNTVRNIEEQTKKIQDEDLEYTHTHTLPTLLNPDLPVTSISSQSIS